MISFAETNQPTTGTELELHRNETVMRGMGIGLDRAEPVKASVGLRIIFAASGPSQHINRATDLYNRDIPVVASQHILYREPFRFRGIHISLSGSSWCCGL